MPSTTTGALYAWSCTDLKLGEQQASDTPKSSIEKPGAGSRLMPPAAAAASGRRLPGCGLRGCGCCGGRGFGGAAGREMLLLLMRLLLLLPLSPLLPLPLPLLLLSLLLLSL